MQMTTMLRGDSSRHGLYNGGTSRNSQEKPEDEGRWYFSRKEIEEDSPSRRDGISLDEETYIRRSYCRFLQDSGLRLKVSPVTIATATIFCHRFFIRQSLAKNDWQTIAIVCMFLAGKAEETPRQLRDVILVSYEVIHKKNPAAIQRIKQKEVYEKQKEVILLGERVVLGTLGFDFNVPNPYKPLVEAIKKFKVAQNPRAPEVAWSFLNDALGTSLCLQFKPHLIAAGAIYLAAKYLKLKLPSDSDKVWWQEFDVTPHQLKEVTNQMLDLYEEREVPPKASVGTEELAARRSNSQGAASLKPGDSKTASSRPLPEQSNAGKHVEPLKATQKQNAINRHLDQLAHQEDTGETERVSRVGSGENVVKDQEKFSGRREAGELKLRCYDEPVGQSSQEAIEKIYKQNRSSPREKRKMPQVELSQGKDLADEDSHILAAENENANGGRRQSWGNTANCSEASEYENGHWQNHSSREGQLRRAEHVKNVEVEVDATDDANHGYRDSSNRNKRKACGLPEQYMQETRQHDKSHGLSADRNKLHRLGG